MASLTAEYYASPLNKPFQAYQLRVVVTEASGLDREVFMFQRGAAKPPTSSESITDNFVCVCDPVDLDEVPVGAPDLLNEMPYYRFSEVTLAFRSVAELMETKQDIEVDLADLIRSINQIPEKMDTQTYD